MVTIRDVAKHAGVSPATASRVLNGSSATPTRHGNVSRPRSRASATKRTTSPGGSRPGRRP
ncbi:LacI family DNA-binding transcriptional regulator [Arthrobacter sp. ES3-54]|uniref:LacI family DNA-binding transcriptional regulator n=1 Tax=Arthrobacter sp. ES3-54 TaxID=1502991 RepID=UPI0024071A9C|nr:LacI family DNA-binding transcriptional regulator [Arthrobacter sp. ES3-54]